MRMFLCGCPKDSCTASPMMVSAGMGKTMKAHRSREEAFNCYAKYLIKSGYTRIGQREFAAPDGGPVMLLSKKSHFGGELRGGKSPQTGNAKRFVPRVRGGVVV